MMNAYTSRYFIDYSYYESILSPPGAYYAMPLPLDICQYNHPNWIIYECNEADNILSKYDHLNYTNCTSPFPIITEFIFTNNTHGALFEFNCFGQNDYLVDRVYNSTEYCDDDRTETNHINTAYTDYYFVPNVCYQNGANYLKFIGNAYYFSEDGYQSLSSCISSTNKWTTYQVVSSSVCSYLYDDVYQEDKRRHRMKLYIQNDTQITIPSDNPDQTVPSSQISALIDFYIATWGYYFWIFCSFFGTSWNLTKVIEGNLYADNGWGSAICGLDVVSQHNKTVVIGLDFYNDYLYGTIPDSICKLTDLEYISFNIEPNLKATIPDCIGNELTNLYDIYIVSTLLTGTLPNNLGYLPNFSYLTIQWTYLNGTVPISLCNMSSSSIILEFLVTNITGDLPSCLFYNANNSIKTATIDFAQTQITGNIPDALCNIKHYSNFYFRLNYQLKSTIPQCISNVSIKYLSIYANPLLYGAVPQNVFCSSQLSIITIAENGQLIGGTVPQCITNSSALAALTLAGNNFKGILPKLPSSCCLVIVLNDNKFEGNVRYIFSDVHGPWLLAFIIHNNKFHSNNISPFLEKLFIESRNLTLLTIANNDIYGSLPDIDITVNMSPLDELAGQSAFIAHDCYLDGTIPSNLKFSSLQYLTLHNNRLSGYLPDVFRDFNRSKPEESVIMPGNHFFVKGSLPNWIVSPFRTAPNLYISAFTEDQTIAVSIVAFIGVLLSIILFGINAAKKINKKYEYIAYDDNDEYGFLQNITFVERQIGDWKMIFCVAILMIIYPIYSNWYSHTTFDAIFNLCWFYVSGQDENWIHWFLLIIAIIYCLVINITVSYICVEQSKNDDKFLEGFEETEKKDDDSLSDDDMVDDIQSKTQQRQKYAKEIMKSIVWTILYLFGLLVIVFYMICTSLPNENALGFDETISIIVARSMSIILALNNSYVSRFLMDSYRYVCCCPFIDKHYSKIKLLLRINNIIIFPTVCSIFLLDGCGKYWTKLWYYCTNSQLRSTFDIEFQPLGITPVLINPLSSDQVCGEPSISSINMNKCIRSFIYNWTGIVMFKIIISHIIIPIIKLGVDFAKYSIKNKWHQHDEMKRVYIDDKFASLVTDLESCLVFSFAAPLIIPLTVMSMEFNKWLYRFMAWKLNWKLTIRNKDGVEKETFPTKFLWIGVILGQLLIILFFIYCIRDKAISYVFGSYLMVLNVVFVFLFSYWKKRMKVDILSQSDVTDNDDTIDEKQPPETPHTSLLSLASIKSYQ